MADTQAAAPAQTPRRADPWKVAFVVLLIVGLLTVVTWLLLGSRLLVVREVQVEGLNRLGTEEVVVAADVPPGTPLVRVDLDAVAERVEELRLVEEATVSRNWPAAVGIAVMERTPVLAVPADGQFMLIDRFGVTVETVPERPAALPELALEGEPEGHPAVAAAAAIVRELPAEVSGLVERIEAADGDTVVLRLRDGAEVVWGDARGGAEKARVLMILLAEHPPAAGLSYDVSAPDVAVVGGLDGAATAGPAA
ncbi:cell division protein FtsQ/DivIB [Allonocardiopsis opalescens]|uniref:Cell division protein FtsQ n=1 Tax=Allonocardiopsis opalescens TaxID=1144618 RepID=A0A2T0Q3V7_9ACTN|nr:FtsQ-type POTRA domain-containing protein [Allonocardiopsis opalescens]PRX98490.1 cell division protein FtsQ [Allonocardiopsis opalescens]